jgi:hypothetical protein
MKITAFVGMVALAIAVTVAMGGRRQAFAGEPSVADYKVLAPIRHGNLTVFPVVAPTSHDTGGFLTLDEGLKSGQVEVTESGSVHGMIRRPPHGSRGTLRPEYQVQEGARQQTVLVNNAKRPRCCWLEKCDRGKQDRVIAKDRIVPAESDPIDWMCSGGPGRWVGPSGKFRRWVCQRHGRPSVRGKAMGDKDQQKVWDQPNRGRRCLKRLRSRRRAPVRIVTDDFTPKSCRTKTSSGKSIRRRFGRKNIRARFSNCGIATRWRCRGNWELV